MGADIAMPAPRLPSNVYVCTWQALTAGAHKSPRNLSFSLIFQILRFAAIAGVSPNSAIGTPAARSHSQTVMGPAQARLLLLSVTMIVLVRGSQHEDIRWGEMLCAIVAMRAPSQSSTYTCTA